MKIKYQDINLGAKSLALIDVCNRIVREYTAAGYILTLRQLFYQLVSRDIIPNKQSEYKRVGSIVNDGRLAGLIDWDALEDRTRNVKSISHWDSPESIIGAVADQYAIDKCKMISERAIDHVNGIAYDNQLSNLRVVRLSENLRGQA